MLKHFKGSKLSAKLFTMTGVSAAIFLAYAILSNNTLSLLKVNGPVYAEIVQGKDLVADILPPPEYIIESYLVCLQALGAKNADEQKACADRLVSLQKDYADRHEFWSKDLPEGAMKTVLLKESYEPAQRFYQLVNESFLPALRAGDKARATALAFGDMQAAYEQHRNAIDRVVTMSNDRNLQTERMAAGLVARRTVWLIFIAVGGMAMSISLAWFIQQLIVSSLSYASVSLGRGAQEVAEAATHLSASSQSLSAGASEQAAAIEETSSSLEQMSGMTRHNAEDARLACEMSQQSRQTIHENVRQMDELKNTVNEVRQFSKEMSASMAAIKESSDAISAIIQTIDGIAFQTNILALNAAVESARAGEAGMGFAVVADEVRNLAKRSAEAARQTSSIIEESIRRGLAGVSVNEKVVQSLCSIDAKAHQVEEGLKRMLEHAEKVDKLVTEIAHGSQEQTQGIEQISTAVEQMDKVTQTNSSESEQTAQAAEELSVQSVELKQTVDVLSRLIHGEGWHGPQNDKGGDFGSDEAPRLRKARSRLKELAAC